MKKLLFINHLNSLDDDIKSQITLIFARCYDFIEKNNDHNQFQNTIGKSATKPLTPPQFQKFKPMATTFCYEVFINLGGKYNIPTERTTERTPFKKKIIIIIHIFSAFLMHFLFDCPNGRYNLSNGQMMMMQLHASLYY